MKRFLLFFLLVPALGFSQFSDDFSDGDFSSNPTWSGEASSFQVVSGQLQLNAPAATDEAHLSTACQAINDATWELDMVLDFNPSGSNRARIYLISDQSNVEGSLNGYFVQVGNAEDEVSLYRQTGSSTTKIIDGPDDLVDSDPVNLSIRVTRSTTGAWELWADTNAAGMQLMGTATDNAHLSSNYFGLWCDYTSTRSDKFFFDNISVTGSAYQDTVAPSVQSMLAINATTLQLVFDEPMDSASIVATQHYSANGGLGNPDAALWQNSAEVSLVFNTGFVANQPYELSISNVTDAAGNALTTTVPFQYAEIGTPVYRSIVINEFMADPSPPVGLPELEYIELFNADTMAFDLNGLMVSDATGNAQVNFSALLLPGQYVIICEDDDTSSFAGFGSVIGVSGLPALNNGGDELSIEINGTLLDRLTYDDTWYGDANKSGGGYSLEQINPFLECTGSSNWTASNAPSGGTPGGENSVFDTSPDTLSPEVIAIEIPGPTQLRVVFNESMDSNSLAGLSLATSSGAVVISQQVIGTPPVELLIGFNMALDSSVAYKIWGFEEATDCAGNQFGKDTLTFGIGVDAAPFDLIISEFYAAPSEAWSLPPHEYIELYNRSEKLIRTDNLRLSDGSSSSALEPGIIPAGAYVIVCDDAFKGVFEALGNVIAVGAMPSLNNASDEIILSRGTKRIDGVSYASSWFDGSDRSMERRALGRLCGLSDNWQPSEDPKGGTPGVANSILSLETDGAPNLLGAFFEDSNRVDFVFDQQLDSASLSTWSVMHNGSALSLISGSHSAGEAAIALPMNHEPGATYAFELGALDGCAGDAFSAQTHSAYRHDSLDVVVNEILFNPIGSGSDFVELYNQSIHPVAIRNWSFATYDEAGQATYKAFESSPLFLPAGSYLVLCEDSSNIQATYPESKAEALVQTDLPSLPNASGTVIIADQFQGICDSLSYSEDWHFPLVDNKDGVSLERIDPQGISHHPGNWHSASSTAGYATPGYENSQFQSLPGSFASFELSNPRISPDNDGYEDVVSILYNSQQTGLVATIKVYSDRGVEVATIANNRLLGNEGSLTWDGTNAVGEKVAIGVYLVVVETFNLAAERNRYKLPLIVAGRL